METKLAGFTESRPEPGGPRRSANQANCCVLLPLQARQLAVGLPIVQSPLRASPRIAISLRPAGRGHRQARNISTPAATIVAIERR
jgi:hypothetical protein